MKNNWIDIGSSQPHNLPPCSKRIVVITNNNISLIGRCIISEITGKRVFIVEDYDSIFCSTLEISDLKWWVFHPENGNKYK